MLVGERMSRPIISITKDMPIHDALILFKKAIITFGLYCNASAKCVDSISSLSASPRLCAPVSRFACDDRLLPTG